MSWAVSNTWHHGQEGEELETIDSQAPAGSSSPSLVSRPLGVLPKPALLLLARIKDELTARADGKAGVVDFEAPDGVALDDVFLDRVHAECFPAMLHIKLMAVGHLLVVEFMASLVHERASSGLSNEIWAALKAGHLSRHVGSNGAARQDLDRTSGQEVRKEPDGSFQPRGRHHRLEGLKNIPTVVIDVGASETLAALRIDVQRWFSSPVTKMIVNVVIAVSVRLIDGHLTVDTVTFVRDHPQPPHNLRSQHVALVEPAQLQHTWTSATPWTHDFAMPSSWFFDWVDSALGTNGAPCPEQTDIVILAEDLNGWCECILEGHRDHPFGV